MGSYEKLWETMVFSGNMIEVCVDFPADHVTEYCAKIGREDGKSCLPALGMTGSMAIEGTGMNLEFVCEILRECGTDIDVIRCKF